MNGVLRENDEKFDEEVLVGFGDVIDRIVCTPVGSSPTMRYGRGGVPINRYKWMSVYDETRRKFGRPLTLLAAEKLKERVKEGDFILITTNSIEMDGPPGAAALARALIVGLKATPVIISDHSDNTKYEKCINDTCIGAHLIPVKEPKLLFEGTWSPYTVLIKRWPPMSLEDATVESKKLMDEFSPKAVITVESVSTNKFGVKHGAMGEAMNPSGDPMQEIGGRWNQILDEANRRGILTIATGDNGNEAGFGTIEDILKEHHKSCAMCCCPCRGGIVSASKADVVIPAQSSNWASYGIEACLATILGKPEVMHDEYTEERILLNCANAGIPDGASAMVTPSTDGSSHESGIYTIGQLRQTVLMYNVQTIREPRRKPQR